MMYGFVIAPSINNEDGAQQYFDQIQRNAEQAVMQPGAQTSEQLLDVCEYMDLVDARSFVAVQPLYRQCVALVTNYLTENVSSVAARTLTKKSWAAKTLNELVMAAQAREQLAQRRYAS